MPELDIHALKTELNPEQLRAVTTIAGPILIIAGAGSGKTRVITYRIAHMLDEGIPQSAILALTFTNKAAREMEERVKSLTGKKLQNLTVSTFHAFGVRILRQDIDKLGWRENFSIYDETDKASLIKESARELQFTSDALDLYKIANLFSNIKTGRKNWETANDMYRALYESYEQGLKLYNAVDFDDLIMLPICLFHEHPDVLAKYRARYTYIMVDEFQDTSRQQYELMRLLADKNIAVVGDDDQSIYSWRGADYQNIVQFEKDFPGVKEIRLEQNYRSTETILSAANGVISHNTNRKDKKLWSGNGSGKPIELFMPENESAEADFIAESIQGIAMEERRTYDDFGILMRANSQSRAIEEALLQANIPYTMSGGTSFFERLEIKDIVSYLRVAANQSDDINLLRIINTPRRGIGRSTISAINETAKQNASTLWDAIRYLQKDPAGALSDSAKKSLGEFIDTIEGARAKLFGGRGLANKVRELIDDVQYRDYIIGEFQKNEKAVRFKLQNIETLLMSIETWENNPDNFDPSLFNYLNRITLLSRDDIEDDGGKGKVNLMTIHASKGLEFPVVFIAGAEEGLMPHARSVEETDGGVEEERRLFYVAITRARDKLLITSCQKRRRMQATVECTPSRFLEEIPENLVEYHEVKKTEPVSEDKAHDYFADMLKKLKS
ncbi:ATP-dependent helicase [Treponema sp. Marseille-Q4523]|uniref:ATP-dependent helicase n=1 Tax=Treponema sp. Marseille-Q4523 TaxID=2810610 RepID=UPI0019620665|nr:UvrD-helicase domain-containing protein [Treponema sp. Marseille-Q4523]MBM7021917.1 UvrD-helicase domain-containing protein [Treponema sp. Marseille-Q4523]